MVSLIICLFQNYGVLSNLWEGKMLYRLILPDWAKAKNSHLKKVLEGRFTHEELVKHNKNFYNIYYLPNSVSNYTSGTIDGSMVDAFDWVFVDCDLKDKIYPDKDSFLEAVSSIDLPPTKVIDSGHGIHVYWRVSNLDAMSYLRFQRRLCKLYKTDEAVGQIFQLMRPAGYNNTKYENRPVPVELLFEDDVSYTAEQLNSLLPPITVEDEAYCKMHYDKTYSLNQNTDIDDALPPRFGKFLKDNSEVKVLWSSVSDDRSKSDYRLAHLMYANGFTKSEALSVLVNSAKALQRAPIHRASYAVNIVDKIWTFEAAPDKDNLDLSLSIQQLLSKGTDTLKGTPFRCHPRIDNTVHGFRLSQVIGLVAGSGVGKTAFALNMFQWFAQINPDYHHFFIPLEQPANEIADRWKTMCGTDDSLHSKIHVMSNFDENGNFRHLSFADIEEYITKWQEKTGYKIGCIVIDHIGALKKKGKNGENQDLMDICHSMKAFAISTNTLLVMQSQSSREKAGIGDLELNKDAAYGTMYFEAYTDYLITLWQPLKRCSFDDACPTVTAFKFCKIRHKKAKLDIIKEDIAYYMYFDSINERMRDMTQDEITSFYYFLPKATNLRKMDRKTDLVTYRGVDYKGEPANVKTKHH